MDADARWTGLDAPEREVWGSEMLALLGRVALAGGLPVGAFAVATRALEPWALLVLAVAGGATAIPAFATRLSIRLRGVAFILVLLLVGSGTLQQLGPVPGAVLPFAAAAVVATLVLGPGAGLLTIIPAAILVLTLGLGCRVDSSARLASQLLHVSTWIRMTGTFAAATAIIVLVVAHALKHLGVSVSEARAAFAKARHDHDERARAQATLRRKEEHLGLALDAAAIATWSLDLNEKRLDWSENVARVLGIPAPAIPGSAEALLLLVHPDDREAAAVRLAAPEDRTSPSTELRLLRPDGDTVWIELRSRLLPDGERPRLLGTIMDVSDRRRDEEAIRRAYDGLKQLARRMEAAKEEERRHIARELHDELAQALTAIKISLKLAAAGGGSGPGDFVDPGSLVERAIQTVRALAQSLRPPLLDEFGLIPALEAHLCEQVRRAGLTFGLRVSPEWRRPPREVETTAFRIVQEAVTNVTRHAKARRLDVILKQEGERLRIIVRDDGCGFDVDEALARARTGAHLGLVGMRERTHALGGLFAITSLPAAGAEIQVELPLGGH